MKKIKLFVTGGTFDKEYNPLKGELCFKETHIPEILSVGRCLCDIDVESIMMVDSLKITDDDRQIILKKCQESTEDQIIIVHGTDTMCDTAKVIGHANLKKTIILTGAMIPYNFHQSDGTFNLGYAIGAIQNFSNGTYIAMNGQTFHWSDVKKNRDKGVFERL